MLRGLTYQIVVLQLKPQHKLSVVSLNAFGLGTKSTKMEDGPTSAERCSLLRKCPVVTHPALTRLNVPRSSRYLIGPSTCWGAVKENAILDSKMDVIRPLRQLKLTWASMHPGYVSLNMQNDNFEGKQFPSIRAMALMGRAMSSFQTC